MPGAGDEVEVNAWLSTDGKARQSGVLGRCSPSPVRGGTIAPPELPKQTHRARSARRGLHGDVHVRDQRRRNAAVTVASGLEPFQFVKCRGE